MTNNFKAVFKILRLLDKYKGDEKFSVELISASALGLKFEEWEQLMIAMQEEGYIKGLVVGQSLTDKFPHIAEPIRPAITFKGMEYLEENSMMAKAREALRMVGEVL